MNTLASIFERLRRLHADVGESLDDSGDTILAPGLQDAPQRLPRPLLVGLALGSDILRALVVAERGCPLGATAASPVSRVGDSEIGSRLLRNLARFKAAYRPLTTGDSRTTHRLLEAYLQDTGAFGFRCGLTTWSAAKTCVRAARVAGDPALIEDYMAILRETLSAVGLSHATLPEGLDEVLTHSEAPPASRQIAIEWAILADDVDGLARFVGPEFSPDRRLLCGLTPWGLAVGAGRQNVADWLLEAGACRAHQQALVVASACWDAARVITLLDCGASPHGSVATPEGRCSPLEAAATARGDRWRALVGRACSDRPGTGDAAADIAATVQALVNAGAFLDSIQMQA